MYTIQFQHNLQYLFKWLFQLHAKENSIDNTTEHIEALIRWPPLYGSFLKLIVLHPICRILFSIVLENVPAYPTNDEPTLVQVPDGCWYWPKSPTPYGITRPQRVRYQFAWKACCRTLVHPLRDQQPHSRHVGRHYGHGHHLQKDILFTMQYIPAKIY